MYYIKIYYWKSKLLPFVISSTFCMFVGIIANTCLKKHFVHEVKDVTV